MALLLRMKLVISVYMQLLHMINTKLMSRDPSSPVIYHVLLLCAVFPEGKMRDPQTLKTCSEWE